MQIKQLERIIRPACATQRTQFVGSSSDTCSKLLFCVIVFLSLQCVDKRYQRVKIIRKLCLFRLNRFRLYDSFVLCYVLVNKISEFFNGNSFGENNILKLFVIGGKRVIITMVDHIVVNIKGLILRADVKIGVRIELQSIVVFHRWNFPIFAVIDVGNIIFVDDVSVVIDNIIVIIRLLCFLWDVLLRTSEISYFHLKRCTAPDECILLRNTLIDGRLLSIISYQWLYGRNLQLVDDILGLLGVGLSLQFCFFKTLCVRPEFTEERRSHFAL